MKNSILLWTNAKDVKVVTYLTMFLMDTNKELAKFSNLDVVIEDKWWRPKTIATNVFHALQDKFSAQQTKDVKIK